MPMASSGNFRPRDWQAHETVFAMTIHKSQGSEFGSVLLIFYVSSEESADPYARELIYTGLTRARDHVEIWSAEGVLRAALAQRASRTSGLRDALWDYPRYVQITMPI